MLGGEVRAELELYATADQDCDAEITGIARLFEGTSEDTTDLEDEFVVRLFARNGNGTKEHISFRNLVQRTTPPSMSRSPTARPVRC